MLTEAWRCTMLGTWRVWQGDTILERFRTRKTASLLAYLAFHKDRLHGREELAGRFWPDADTELGLKSLRVCLSSLRPMLEPPGVTAGEVLIADRVSVRLNPNTITTDAADFERLLRTARHIVDAAERIAVLESAEGVYGGELLPGFYEEWIFPERDRLAQARLQSLDTLLNLLTLAGDTVRALPFALRRAQADAYDEAAQVRFLRLCLTAHQPADALRHYEHMVRQFQTDSGPEPSEEARALLAQLRVSGFGGQKETAPSPTPDAQRLPSPNPESRNPKPESRLPLTTTRFFGRETEMDRIIGFLSDPECRLLTLTGSGGSGKTRLSIEAARRFAGTFAGNIVFVPLADVTAPSLVADALRAAQQIPPSPQLSAEEQILEVLSRDEIGTLLLLDNLEQLLAPEKGDEAGLLPELVRSLLMHVPTLKILAVSRVTIGLEGEQEFPIGPLPTPTLPGTPERLLEFASVCLYADRARLKRPDFQITPRNADAVATLCDALEGIPLALELAAGWARVFTPAETLARLQPGLNALSSRVKNLPERHQTLEAAVAWSYDLLTPQQRQFLRRLSLFRGGWTTDAAATLLETPDSASPLNELIARSLIVSEVVSTPDGEKTRFRMLETIRQYAQERLDENGETEATRLRLRDYFGQWVQTVWGRGWRRTAAPLAEFDAEHDNLRATLDAIGDSEEDLRAGLNLATIVSRFWMERGHYREGRERLAALLARVPENGREKFALARSRALDELASHQIWQQDFPAAHVALQESLELARNAGGEREIASALLRLGWMASTQGRAADAQPLYEECLAIQERLGEDTEMVRSGLAHGFEEMGDTGTARALYVEGVRRTMATENQKMQCVWLVGLLFLEVRSGNFNAVADSLNLALTVALPAEGVMDALPMIACAALYTAHEGQPERAARLFGALEALCQTAGMPPPLVTVSPLKEPLDRMIADAAQTLGASAWDTLRAAGAMLTLPEVLNEIRRNLPVAKPAPVLQRR